MKVVGGHVSDGGGDVFIGGNRMLENVTVLGDRQDVHVRGDEIVYLGLLGSSYRDVMVLCLVWLMVVDGYDEM